MMKTCKECLHKEVCAIKSGYDKAAGDLPRNMLRSFKFDSDQVGGNCHHHLIYLETSVEARVSELKGYQRMVEWFSVMVKIKDSDKCVFDGQDDAWRREHSERLAETAAKFKSLLDDLTK